MIGIDYVELDCAIEQIKRYPDKIIAKPTALGCNSVSIIKSKAPRTHQSKIERTYKALGIDLSMMYLTIIREVCTNKVMVPSMTVAKSLKFKDAKWEVAIPWKYDRNLPPFK